MNKLFILLISAALFSYCQPTTTDTENLEESSDSLTTGVTTEVVPIKQAPTYVEESASVPPAPKRPKVVTETEEASNESLKEVDVKAVFPGCESHKKLARRDICTTRSWRDYVEDNLEFGDSILLDKSAEHFLFIRYEDLCNNPDNVIKSIYKYLEIEEYKHNFDYIPQITVENDTVHGIYGDHIIRNKLEMEREDYREVLGDNACDWIVSNFKWYFNSFAYF